MKKHTATIGSSDIVIEHTTVDDSINPAAIATLVSDDRAVDERYRISSAAITNCAVAGKGAIGGGNKSRSRIAQPAAIAAGMIAVEGAMIHQRRLVKFAIVKSAAIMHG